MESTMFRYIHYEWSKCNSNLFNYQRVHPIQIPLNHYKSHYRNHYQSHEITIKLVSFPIKEPPETTMEKVPVQTAQRVVNVTGDPLVNV